MAEDPDPTEYLFISLEQKRKDQTKPYDGKKMVWVPDEKECYILGNIASTKGDIVTVECGKGDEVSSIIVYTCFRYQMYHLMIFFTNQFFYLLFVIISQFCDVYFSSKQNDLD